MAHLGERLELLDRVGEVAGACLQLLEQAHVLNCDDRLRGKCFQQIDLLVCEWPNLWPSQKDRANRFVLPQHRYCQRSAVPESTSVSLRSREFLIRCSEHVLHMNNTALQNGSR